MERNRGEWRDGEMERQKEREREGERLMGWVGNSKIAPLFLNRQHILFSQVDT
jgi:hypothetical protein